MDFEPRGSSSRPYTVVRIPAMWKVFDEIEGGGVEWVSERGLGVAMINFVQCKVVNNDEQMGEERRSINIDTEDIS